MSDGDGAVSDTGASDADAGVATEAAGPSSARRQLPALAVLAAIALLVIGMGIGAAVGVALSRDDSPPVAAVPAGDSVDVGFNRDMTVHHKQAVEMAAIELTNGADARIKAIAYDILTTQQEQIGRMQGWLALWGLSGTGVGGTYMAWMTGAEGDGHHHDHAMPSTPAAPGAETPEMPGMATPSDIARLRGLRGAEADVLFLQLMLRHHLGGVPMAEYAAANAKVDAVRNLATSIISVQGQESTLMRGLLADRRAPELPMN